MGAAWSELLEDPPSEFETMTKIRQRVRAIEVQKLRAETEGDEHMMIVYSMQLEHLKRLQRDVVTASTRMSMSEVDDYVTRYLKASTRQLEENLIDQAIQRRDVLPKLDMVHEMAEEADREYEDRHEELAKSRENDDRYQERLQALRVAQLPVAPNPGGRVKQEEETFSAL